MRIRSWTQRTWLKYRYRERELSAGATFAALTAVSCAQGILSGMQIWQPLETVFAAVTGLAGLLAAVLWISGYPLSRMARYALYFCGIVTVVVTIVGDITINRASIKFGELPAWFAAVGTVGALTVSLSLLTRQASERRSAQAYLVSSWTENLLLNRQPFPVLITLVKNGSGQAIYSVQLSVAVGVRGTFTRYLGSMGPGELREVPIPLPAPPRASEIAPAISFVDGTGNRWLRTGNGRLFNPTWSEIMKYTTEDAGAYDDISNHPTINLHLDDEQYRDKQR